MELLHQSIGGIALAILGYVAIERLTGGGRR
jgi:hypothetical protein